MAEVNTGGGDDHGGKKRAKKQSTRIDMTPMVDLAFLLLTFFVLTSTFSKPKTLEINFPADPKDPNFKPPKVTNALTFLLTEGNKIYYYFGEFFPAPKEENPATVLEQTDFSKEGLRKVLLKYNDWTIKEIDRLEEQVKSKQIADTTFKRLAMKAKGDRKAVMALIKTDDKATYKNVIDMVDELNITDVGKYAIVEMEKAELDLLTQTNNK